MSNKTFRILSVSLLLLIFLAMTRLLEVLIGVAIGGWALWVAIFVMVLIGRALYKAQHKMSENPN